MIECIPLEKAVNEEAYQMVKGLLGEETAFLLLYEPFCESAHNGHPPREGPHDSDRSD